MDGRNKVGDQSVYKLISIYWCAFLLLLIIIILLYIGLMQGLWIIKN